MATLQYFDLISPEPVWAEGFGHLLCPTLRKIARCGFETYCSYLNILLLDLDHYLLLSGLEQAFSTLTEVQRQEIQLFNLLVFDRQTRALLANVFSFFLTGTVTFDEEQQCFIHWEEENETGRIDNKNYAAICSILLEMNYIRGDDLDRKKFSSEKARQIAEKMKKAKESVKKHTSENKDMTLANIISALCVQHNSLNMENIWDLTIYQVYDQFFRQNYKNQMDIHAMNYAGWGGEFDSSDWFKSLHDI